MKLNERIKIEGEKIGLTVSQLKPILLLSALTQLERGDLTILNDAPLTNDEKAILNEAK